ncbi:PLCX1 protein, partial [Amia calva]|nr:PLCX1 protein [Amia calva]
FESLLMSLGSHDAMSYCLDMCSPVQESEPLTIKALDYIMPCFTRPCLYKWGTAQAHSIAEQLDSGMRYFDFRITHKKHDTSDNLYFAHGVYTLMTVQEALKDIAQWLTCHPKEIVILACSHFEGLSNELHENLVFFMKQLFGDKICPYMELQETLTLRSFWRLGYQVIISYDDSALIKRHKELWPVIPYWWANQVDPQDVLQYLEQQKQKGRPGGFFVAGLNLTENTQYVILHPRASLKTMTQHSYSSFLEWIGKQSPGPGKACLNIICEDFVGINNFASDVIHLNQKLLEPDIVTLS